MINYKKLSIAFIAGTIALFSLTGCNMPWQRTTADTTDNQENTSTITANALVSMPETDLKLDFDAEDLDASWNVSDCTNIQLSDEQTVIDGSGATFDGTDVLITSSGSYCITGTLTNGSIHVNVADKNTVRIILNGVTITNDKNAPVVVEDAKKVIVTLADGTTNEVSDSARTSTDAQDYSAAISSKADMIFNGNGTLKVNANYRNGIKSSDDLKIVSGNFIVNSAEDGIIGKDILGIKNGSFDIKAGSDGMKSNNDTNSEKGNVIIEDGNIKIEAANDGIQAENSMLIQSGTFEIKTSEGAKTVTNTGNNIFGQRVNSTNVDTSEESSSDSYKGLKAGGSLYINNGTFTLNCTDDAIHTNNAILICGGDITIKTGDDGIHADQALQIDGGKVDIQQSYEGLEAAQIQINNGDISVVSSDDGINASDGSSTSNQGGMMHGGGNMNSNNMMPSGSDTDSSITQQPQQLPDNSSSTSEVSFEMNGGKLFVNANGDGLDANGTITINGGETIVCGPTSDGDTAVDFDAACTLNGGTLLAFGSSGMVETPTSASNGACIVSGFSSSVNANTTFTLYDEKGIELMKYVPVKNYACVIVYSSQIKTGNSYTLNADGQSQSITVNDAVTSNVTGGMNGGGRGGMQRPNQNGDNGNMQMPNQNGNNGNMQIPDQNGDNGNMQMPNQNGDNGNMQIPDQNGNGGNMQKPDRTGKQNNNSL